MHPFWENLYDDAKDKRYGTLFVTALFIGTPLFVLAVCLANATCGQFMDFLTGYSDLSPLQVVCLAALTGVIFVVLALCLRRWVRTERKIRHERLNYSNLSRDELLKARSKLKNQMNPVKFRTAERPGKKRPPLRPPDTDLKY
jgi:uncharacterized integral membrane protein